MKKTEISERLKISKNEMELIDFRIYEMRDGEKYSGVYGINVAKVNEIIHMPVITEMPASVPYVLGIFDLRGSVMPIIDLAKWMNIKPTDVVLPENRYVIVTEFNNLQMGFIVDEVKRIRRISWGQIEPATYSATSEDSSFKITGSTKIEGGETLLILDLESIVDNLDFYSDITEANKTLTRKVDKKTFKGLVLVLDDSTTARKLITKALTEMGFDIVEAHDGEDGLEQLDKLYERYGDKLTSHLKVIISDVEMPKMDGFHFAEHVHNDERYKSIPLIFNSSICDKYSEEKGLKIGAEGYLVKFNADVLHDTIKDILSKGEERNATKA